MTIIPNQPFGLGDIIFTQTLVRRIADGRPIIWPVFPQFLEGLKRAYLDINFVDWTQFKLNYERRDQYEYDSFGGPCTVLPIRFADSIMKVPYSECMASKYAMYGMKWEDWQEQAMWARDENLEYEVGSEWQHMMSGADGGYYLCNDTFGSDSKLKIKLPSHIYRNSIIMSHIPGCSLFDWATLIEGAREIHTVSTSIIYLLEMLDLKAKELHLYPRKPIEHDFRNVDYLLRRHKYVLHG